MNQKGLKCSSASEAAGQEERGANIYSWTEVFCRVFDKGLRKNVEAKYCRTTITKLLRKSQRHQQDVGGTRIQQGQNGSFSG